MSGFNKIIIEQEVKRVPRQNYCKSNSVYYISFVRNDQKPDLLASFRLFVKPKARLITLIMSAIIQFQCMQRKGCDDILLLFLSYSN